MSQAKKSQESENQQDMTEKKYLLQLTALEKAVASILASETALYKALDDIIPTAIKKSVETQNCMYLQKIAAVLKPYHKAEKILTAFIEYCEDPYNGLNFPRDTIVYAKSVYAIMCNVEKLTAWLATEENAKRLETKSFMQWKEAKEAEKKNKKKDKKDPEPIKETRTAAKKLRDVIVKYGLHIQSNNLAIIKRLLDQELED